MIYKKINALLLIAGLGFSSGCTSTGLKMPFRDTFASRSTKTHSAAGDVEELSPEFRAAQKMFKKDPERTLLAWARWQEDVGEYGEARKKYRELLIAYPDNIDAQLGLARIELACGRIQQAEDILTQDAKTNPSNAPVRLELGRLYSQQEDWPKAIASFEAASAIDTENQVCRYELGVAFARCHQYDQALSHLTFAVGESAANYNIGFVLHEQAKDGEAAEWFKNALQSHPDALTAEKAKAMLAQLSPQSSRVRNTSPTYPSASPSEEFIAGRSRPAAMDQFEPASFEAPVISGAVGISGRSRSSRAVPITRAANTREYVESSELLPPVTQQPISYGTSNSSDVYSSQPSVSDGSPFRAVSHTTSHKSAGQPNDSDRKPPQWHGASQATTAAQLPSVHDTTPGKWRSR
ncbi:MAG: tetratricopeptide repeat protein [Planctomycetota bacterium]|nr:tetratricopeptide repeat protein [Planctomycetota bacterium]